MSASQSVQTPLQRPIEAVTLTRHAVATKLGEEQPIAGAMQCGRNHSPPILLHGILNGPVVPKSTCHRNTKFKNGETLSSKRKRLPLNIYI